MEDKHEGDASTQSANVNRFREIHDVARSRLVCRDRGRESSHDFVTAKKEGGDGKEQQELRDSLEKVPYHACHARFAYPACLLWLQRLRSAHLTMHVLVSVVVSVFVCVRVSSCLPVSFSVSEFSL